MNIRNILAGVDFQKRTADVLAYASLFAKNLEASLHLLHVIDYLVTPPAYLDQYIDTEKSAAEEKLGIMERELTGLGIRVNSSVLIGRLQTSFETALQKSGADLLVLGFASHAFRRSSSEKLIKGLQTPMLVIRGKKSESAAGEISVKRILCPVDFSDLSQQALDSARKLSRTFSAEIEVLHVLQESALKKIQPREAKNEAMKKLVEQETGRLNDLLSARSFTLTGAMEQGEPYKRIVSFAKDKDIDLIVMGARGLGLIKGMLIGSVTDAVLKSAPCPVFVIH